MEPAQARDEVERLLEELLERHTLRQRAGHGRARADVGPSLFGGMRSFDHYTYDYVRRAADDCLRDASMVLLEYAHERELEPTVLIAAARDRLARHFAEVMDYLRDDLNQPPAHEYGMRPTREALAEVGRSLDERLAAAMTAIGRGRLDGRLEPKRNTFGRLLEAAGGGHRVAMVVVAVLLIWLLLAGL
ncbi:MAG: hypothetical protein QF578_14150 [Alphaproteobacteria bacterium]|jgi:hypothetical protein|nr:hypothetical protein [Alphaproteobacteria bacterium]MDP6565964.1 hypothetical protein [Alphaproteobacteria bacterium]MDP6814317.1 hypothetical protein [Alphaproteobacteria bacterium]